ncbi:MAG: permease [Treponematales bacterium]
MKKRTMLLLWLGAAISISEIYTGGLIAPLGFAAGAAAILLGHAVGAGLLALGSFVSFTRGENAMESVAFSLGRGGGKISALLNVTQLAGWTIVMVVQGASAVSGVFPQVPFGAAAAVLALLTLVWALLLTSPAGRLNEAAVALLAALCAALFYEALTRSGAGISGGGGGAMSFSLALELSIVMPVSWLPLAGDYGAKASDKTCAAWMPFAGYFTGSALMYCLGLFLAVRSGLDIFAFISASRFRFAACAVVLLSTLTTAFLDLYSAAVSSRQLVKTKSERTPALVIGVAALVVSVAFPVEKYDAFLEGFLSAIGMVFVPIYTVLFLDFFFKRARCAKLFAPWGLAVSALGMAAYRIFSAREVWIPTVLTILVVCALYAPYLAYTKRKAAGRRP